MNEVDYGIEAFLNSGGSRKHPVEYGLKQQLDYISRLAYYFGLVKAGEFLQNIMREDAQRHTIEALDKKGVHVGSLVDYVRNVEGVATQKKYHVSSTSMSSP